MQLAEVKPGQVWRWKRPDGKYREMLVQYIQDGPGVRRAMGVHPRSGRRLQTPCSRLMHGNDGAELLRTIEGFTYERRPGSGRA